MPLDDSQKNTIVLGVTNVVRNTLSADVQRVSLAFRMLIDQLEPGQPIELQPFVDYLIAEQKVPETLALELCVILRSREDRLKVTFVMPEKVNFMPAERQEAVVKAFNSRQDTTGAWEKKSSEMPKPTNEKSSSTWQPDKRKKGPPPKRTKPLLGAVAAGIVGLIAFYGYREATKPPPQVDVHVPSDGLPCQGSNVAAIGKIAICTLSKSWWDAQAPETASAKADITKKSLASHGVAQLQVLTKENNRIVLVR